MAERTGEQHQVLNHWARYGAESFVTKLGRGWVVEVNGYRTPHVFRTKRAAAEHADGAVRAFTRVEG